MDSKAQKSILQMARGAIQERADYEMTRILENILDYNTSPTAKRKLVITLELKPDDSRQNISVSCTAKSTLAATNPSRRPCMLPVTIPSLRWSPRSPADGYGWE